MKHYDWTSANRRRPDDAANPRGLPASPADQTHRPGFGRAVRGRPKAGPDLRLCHTRSGAPVARAAFLTVPAQAGLRQGGGERAVLVETITAGAFSLAAHQLHQ